MRIMPSCRIFNDDCVEGMKLFPAESIDLVITDPPFGINLVPHHSAYNRTQSHVMEGYEEIKACQYLDFSRRWLTEVYRLLKDSGSVFIFSGWTNLKDILVAVDDVGFTIINHIIWKYQFGVVCKRKFISSHYHCLFLCKNDKKRKFFNSARFNKNDKTETGGSARYRDLEDVWIIKREYWRGDKKTPNKLPTEIIEKILAYTSELDDLVMDPFLGSGQVAVISKRMGRRYLGFEIVPEYYAFAKERLEKGIYRIKSDARKDYV